MARMLAPPMGRLDLRTAQPMPKVADEGYKTQEHLDWAEQVIKRANGRCQWVDDNGVRCQRRAPTDRVVADHIVEVKDGGARYDLGNGQCLCVKHNTLKGLKARSRRHAQAL